MATETIKLAVDNAQALRAINQVSDSVNSLGARLGNLRNILGGLAIGSFITSVVNSAKALTDLSGVSGIATDRILALRLAFQANGAAAEDADKALLKLLQSIGEAQQENLALQDAFNRVGVSLQDLRTLTEEDIFLKVIRGLDQITDRSLRAALSQQLLGKSLRTADYAGVIRDQERFSDQTQGTAESIARIDEASKKLEEAFESLKLVTLSILEPFADFINSLDLSAEKVAEYTKIILGLIAALIGFTAFGRVGKVLIEVLRGLGVNFGALSTAVKVFIGAIAESIRWIAALAGYQIAQNALTEDSTDALKDEIKAKNDNVKKTLEQNDALLGEFVERRKVIDALNKQKNELRELTKGYLDNNRLIVSRITQEKDLMSVSEDAREIAKAQNDIYERAIDAITALQKRKSTLKEEERGLIPVINEQIRIIEQSITADQIRVEEALKGLQKRRIEQEKLRFEMELMNQELADNVSIQQIEQQIALVGLFGEELENNTQILEVTRELQNKLVDLQKQLNDLELRRTELGEERYQQELEYLNQLIQKAYEYAGVRIEAEQQVLEAQRKAQEDWQGALKQQLEDLADSITPAQVAVDLFGSVIGSIDRALTDFVEKGKFSFKEFARSIIRDMALIVARALVMRAVLAAVGMIFPGAATGLSAIMNAAPRRFGGQVDPGNPYLVGEAGPELFMPKSAGTIVPNNQLMQAAPTQVVYQIQAVDAASFRSLVARDPQFIYNVTEVGRRSNPARRLG